MAKPLILWVDDEIEYLKPHIMFLDSRGYEVITASNGHDALDICKERPEIELVILDESMPGMTGLEVMESLNKFRPNLKTIMVTKNESDEVMKSAFGKDTQAYLLKPVVSQQVYASVAGLLNKKAFVQQDTNIGYTKEHQQILSDIYEDPNHEQWVEIYKKFISWELKMFQNDNQVFMDNLINQKATANQAFSKYIAQNYEAWLRDGTGPLLSHHLLKKKVFPHLVNQDRPTVFLLMDNLRLDHWMAIEPVIGEVFKEEESDSFFSILPTTTQFSRNAIFSGLLPAEIEKKYKDKWKNDTEEGGKNDFEAFFLEEQLKRHIRQPIKMEYFKVTNAEAANSLEQKMVNMVQKDFVVIVYNFIDMLSHAGTEMDFVKQLANNDQSYRELVKNWFVNSPLWKSLKRIAEKDIQLIISTDHGTIKVKTPTSIKAEKDTTNNLRYKSGKNLSFEPKDVFAIKNPSSVGLPSLNLSSSYVFALEDKFFLYPNNFNRIKQLYSDTYQHGGISMEEMICPFARFVPK